MTCSASSAEQGEIRRGGRPEDQPHAALPTVPGFSRIFVNADARDLPACVNALSRLPGIPVESVSSQGGIPREHLNSGSLYITASRGNVVGKCPGSRGHVCCNYVTADVYLGCTIGCSYCIMRSYLNFSPITVYADPRPAIRSLRELAELNAERIVRAGTGEVGDSLLYDPLFELSSTFIEELADVPNLLLELKTKTDHVDHLPRLGKNGNIVIGFSLNPQEIIDSEEPCAASLERRLEAAVRAAERGYRIAFHFDPVIAEEGWEDRYLPVARSLSRFRGCRTAWISMGTIRFPAPLRDALETRPYLCDEFIPCADGKFRYVQVRRIAVYRRLLAELRAALDTPVYLCMESDEVWRRVFGSTPRRMEKLRELFTPVRISPAR